jgi:hypothetical protein
MDRKLAAPGAAAAIDKKARAAAADNMDANAGNLGRLHLIRGGRA